MSEAREQLDAEIAEMRQRYSDWHEVYGPMKAIGYVPTETEQAELRAAGNEYIFTYNTTCDQEILTNGFHDYSGAMCCWGVIEYYISEKPCEEGDSVWLAMSMSGFCVNCNPECDDELEEFNDDCEDCNGNGYATYYAD